MRIWMIELRKSMGLSLAEMAQRCGCSEVLLDYLEMRDSRTLPSLARRIGTGYGMTLHQANELAKPLQQRYVMVAGRGGGTFEWCPPKAETKPLLDFAHEQPVEEANPLYLLIDELVKATGKTPRQLSLEAGRTGSYIGNMMLAVQAGRVLSPQTRKKLAAMLNCEERVLKGGDAGAPAHIQAVP